MHFLSLISLAKTNQTCRSIKLCKTLLLAASLLSSSQQYVREYSMLAKLEDYETHIKKTKRKKEQQRKQNTQKQGNPASFLYPSETYLSTQWVIR